MLGHFTKSASILTDQETQMVGNDRCPATICNTAKHAKFSEKLSYPLIRTSTRAYQGVRNVHFRKILRASFTWNNRFGIHPFALLATNSCQSFNLAELNQTALSPSPIQVLDHWQRLQNNKVKSFKITENTFWMMSFWDREHYFWKNYLALMINLKKYFPTGLFVGDFKQLFLWSYWTMWTDTTQQSFKEVQS